MRMTQKQNVLLTPRDLTVLESLYDNIVLTYSQIAKRHFTNIAKPTVLNRMTKLESAGFIRRERIPRMELGLDQNAIGVVYQITSDGIAALRSRQWEREFRKSPIRLHAHSLHHDLILVDLRWALKNHFNECEITNGKLIARSQGESGVEPDLIVRSPKAVTAVELELSGKSEKRYREIVLRYRLSKKFERVIYFINDPFIKDILTRVIVNRPVHPKETPCTGKFYFAQLNDFLSNPNHSAITNGSSDWEKGVL